MHEIYLRYQELMRHDKKKISSFFSFETLFWSSKGQWGVCLYSLWAKICLQGGLNQQTQGVTGGKAPLAWETGLKRSPFAASDTRIDRYHPISRLHPEQQHCEVRCKVGFQDAKHPKVHWKCLQLMGGKVKGPQKHARSLDKTYDLQQNVYMPMTQYQIPLQGKEKGGF